jgi:hypothetical protein
VLRGPCAGFAELEHAPRAVRLTIVTTARLHNRPARRIVGSFPKNFSD